MSQFKVDKGVPLPSKHSKRRGQSKYPFATMEVGDSFLVDKEVRIRIISAVAVYRKNVSPKSKFTIRVVDDGVRVWRIK